MTRKVSSAGVGIAYEVIGEGLPLVLLHLLFETKEFWQSASYVDAFRRMGHQLILIDASGHGESDKPHDEKAYSLN